MLIIQKFMYIAFYQRFKKKTSYILIIMYEKKCKRWKNKFV